MILIVNTTSDTAITEELKRSIEENKLEAEIVEAGELKISHCIGCNYCWLKTPGECSIKDDYEFILKKMVHAEELWVISDTALGFLDHKGKKIFDRIIPLATMNLHFVGKEMRHIPRYDRSPDIGIIYSGEADKEFLKRWNERAALNLGSRSLGVFEKTEVKEAVSSMGGSSFRTQVPVTAGSSADKQGSGTADSSGQDAGTLIIINGSPRIKRDSNTDKILNKFTSGLGENGVSYKQYEISDRSEWDEILKAYQNNKNILIALPLYVECIPGLLMEFLETLSPKNDGTRLSFILQGGFAEGAQLRCGEEYLKILSRKLQCEYAGTLIKGDNFSIRFTGEEERERITGPYRQMGSEFSKNMDFNSEECRRFTGVEVFSVPVRVILGIVFKTFAKKRFAQIAKELGCSRPVDYRPY